MNTSARKKKTHGTSAVVRTFVVVLALLLCLTGLMPLLGAASDSEAEQTVILIDDGKVVPGVKIAGVDVGGQTPEQAAVTIAPTAQEMLDATMMTIQFPDTVEQVPIAKFGVQADVATATKSMMDVGRGGNISERLQQRESAAQGQINLPMGYTHDEETIRAKAKEYVDGISRESVSEEVHFDPSLPERFTFTDGHMGFEPDEQAFIDTIVNALQTGNLSNVQAQGHSVDGPVPEDKNAREHTKLISKFTTKTKRNASRNHNIKLATERINGKIVQPGETFSCNEAIGPRTDANVWKEAPAIQNRVSVMGLGGGVCQVSTTMYEAVLMGDYNIVYRQAHSSRLSYVPGGLDATINTGTIDFKWSNNTEAPIYVFTWIDKEQKRIWCEIYGLPFAADAGFDEIELISERLPDIEPTADEYITYSGLTAPYWMLKNAAKTGYAYDTFKSYKLNGVEVKREPIANTVYRMHPRRYYVWPGYVAGTPLQAEYQLPLPQKNN